MAREDVRITFRQIAGKVFPGQLPDSLKDSYELQTGVKQHIEDSLIHLNAEAVQDVVGALVSAGVGITATYNDAGDVLSVSLDFSEFDAGDIDVARLSGSTYSSIQHFMDFMAAAGQISGGVITGAGAGAVDVSAGTGFIKQTNSHLAESVFFDWSGAIGISIPLNTKRYIGVEYNGGSPQIISREFDTFNLSTEFPLGEAVNEGGDIHILNNPWKTGHPISHIIERLQSVGTIIRDQRIGGLILGETGIRNVTMSGGTLWSRLSDYIIPAIDTSGADSFTTKYRDGSGGWVTGSGVSQWPNTQWDNGSGTLVELTNNRYANLWFYIETDGHLIMLYPQAEYANQSIAENEQPPVDLPNRILETGLIVGRFLFQKGDNTATLISSAFETVFAGSGASSGGVTDHGNLSGLQDDDHSQYHTDARALAWLETQQGTPAQILAKVHML